MNKETYTTMSESGIDDYKVTITVRHDADYECGFRVEIGCIDEYVTVDSLNRLHKLIGAALREYKKVTA